MTYALVPSLTAILVNSDFFYIRKWMAAVHLINVSYMLE